MKVDKMSKWSDPSSSFYKISSLINFLAALGLRCCSGHSLVDVHGLPTAVASLVAEHRAWVQKLSYTGVVALWRVGSYFPDQGSILCPTHWQADSYSLCHQGSLHTRLNDLSPV